MFGCEFPFLSLSLLFFLLMAYLYVAGFRELNEKVGSQKLPKTYSSRKLLHRRILDLHPAYKSFVSGAKNGQATYFHCRVCRRDVAMKTQGSGEFRRHFECDKHWIKDVIYMVHMGLSVLNRLMEPMDLTMIQMAQYRAKPFENLGEEDPFPDDFVPKHSRVDFKVPFMTFVGYLGELLRNGGDFTFLRRLWGHFRSSLGDWKPEFALNWSRSETVVRYFPSVSACLAL